MVAPQGFFQVVALQKDTEGRKVRDPTPICRVKAASVLV